MNDLLLGTDICQISRIQKAYEKFGDRFLEKTFTPAEIAYAKSSRVKIYERLAVRFATKEAVSKALGVGIRKMGWAKGIHWKDVEIIRGSLSNIDIVLTGRAKELATTKSVINWKVSVSHMGDYAVSTVTGIVE
jgi:holo-[acyl-carrier protein] synthase